MRRGPEKCSYPRCQRALCPVKYRDFLQMRKRLVTSARHGHGLWTRRHPSAVADPLLRLPLAPGLRCVVGDLVSDRVGVNTVGRSTVWLAKRPKPDSKISPPGSTRVTMPAFDRVNRSSVYGLCPHLNRWHQFGQTQFAANRAQRKHSGVNRRVEGMQAQDWH